MTAAKMLNVFHELVCLLKPKEGVIIDISTSEIIEAKKTRADLPIEFVVGDTHHLPFKEKSAEGVICSTF